MKAMILAAGRGERLKPLTNTTPKALIEVKGQPLIVHHLYNLKHSGICDIVINLAYLSEKIEATLGNGQSFGVNIAYSKEIGGGLETGGGIANALPLLGEEPFIVINADVYSDYPFSQLPLKPDKLAHLVLVNNPAHNQQGDYSFDNGLIRYPCHNVTHTFAGIAVYRPAFFSHSSRYERFSVTPMVRAAANLDLISGELYHGNWFDVGTQERLLQACAS